MGKSVKTMLILRMIQRRLNVPHKLVEKVAKQEILPK